MESFKNMFLPENLGGKLREKKFWRISLKSVKECRASLLRKREKKSKGFSIFL
jgi:hypothetical protein